MASIKKLARVAFRFVRLTGLGIGGMAAVLGFVADASGGATFWTLSASSWFDLGLLLIALFCVASVIRHDFLLHEFGELWGNEHAQSLMRDGIPPWRETYFQYVRRGEYATVHRFWLAGIYNVTDASGNSDLGAACEFGHAAIVRGIIERGGDPKRPNETGMTPLMLAAARGHKGVVDVLLEFDSAVHAKSSEDGVSALYAAASHGHAEIVHKLIEADAPIDSLDHDNIVPLMAAISRRQWDCVDLLMDAGADLTGTDRFGANMADYLGCWPLRQLKGQPIVERVRDAGVVRSEPQLLNSGTTHLYSGKVQPNWKPAEAVLNQQPANG